jgi:hypothetical protein
MIYSRDIVQLIVNNKYLIIENQFADDWVIGKFLEEQGLKPNDNVPYYNLCDNWPETELLAKMYVTPKEELEKHIFFRCKHY